MLKQGFYEQVISTQLNDRLDQLLSENPDATRIDRRPVGKAEAPRVLAQYISGLVEQAFEQLAESSKSEDDVLARQRQLANDIVGLLVQATDDRDFDSQTVAEKTEQLLAVLDTRNTALALDEKASLPRPLTSLAQTSLLTGAVHEPAMFGELKAEIATCDEICMLVSFIKWSGLRLLLPELRQFADRGGTIRVITTSYLGATDVRAVKELAALTGATIKVSYDTQRTRLHAKAYIFHRQTGFTTAYVGSSNISNPALSSGLEWNVKLARYDQPEVLAKVEATFETYWNDSEFVEYDESQFEQLKAALRRERQNQRGAAAGQEGPDAPGTQAAYVLDVAPYAFQQEILDKLAAEREVHGRNRNLVVAATGTGKTVISAFDYKRFCEQNPGKPNRLLFVAHREEILEQSVATFRAILKDANFGDLLVGGYRAGEIDHLFISVQTFNSRDFTRLTTPDFYDFIIVDEFHHAAAASYQGLLAYYQPMVLLGLTATPERMDGKNILEYFDDHIAAEIRLPEAIDRKLLCPFQYFGVTDDVDLSQLKWTRGSYETSELNNVYVWNTEVARRRARLVASSVNRYVTSLDEVKGLGFCVSVEHAQFMANEFNAMGIPSMSLTGKSSDEVRSNAKNKLVRGEVRFIFVVDIYNEGVDIPEVNTVLFLRPTESLTVFLQQLGRGLRLSPGKDCLTVLDFIGQANSHYNFRAKFEALLEHSTRGIQRELKDGFVSMPKGCFIQLEKKAQEYVLDNIRKAYDRAAGMVAMIADFEEASGKPLTLGGFLDYHALDPRALYKRGLSFARMSVKAGLREDFSEPLEDVLEKALPRFACADSRRWIQFLLRVLPAIGDIELGVLSAMELRMAQMLAITVWPGSGLAEKWDMSQMQDELRGLASAPVLLGEVCDLLRYKLERIDFVDQAVDLGFDCPLDLHCTYSRDQVLVAMGLPNPSTVREGVKWLPEVGVDVLFVTLNKSEKDYSPTTMYQDYSMSEVLFHWQSQSTTSDASKTGRRYIDHERQGSKVTLFVRDAKTDAVGGGAGFYTYLGTVCYQSHEGSKPMNVVWRLDEPIPSRFLQRTNKLLIA